MRIFEDIYIIPGFVNSYLVEREHDCVLIDTGMSKKANNTIRAIKSYCSDKPLKAIIITHSHLDHIGGLETLGNLFGAEVVSHKEESPFIMKTKKLPSKQGFFGKLTRSFSNISFGSGHKINQMVTNGEIVYGLKVFHLPGHTPGSIALEDTETSALFCGDIINTNKKGDTILPPKKSFASNYEQALESSIKMFKLSKPKVILPGHGKPIIDPENAIKIYIEKYS